jgi:hypothetical protein
MQSINIRKVELVISYINFRHCSLLSAVIICVVVSISSMLLLTIYSWIQKYF